MRVGVLPFYYLLYKNKYFENQRQVNKRMALLLIGNVGVIALGDYLASECMWNTCGLVVTKHSQYDRSYTKQTGNLDDLFKGFQQ